MKNLFSSYHPAVQQAQQLQRREFLRRTATLGAALGLGSAATLAPMNTARAAEYRALVCVFLYGGNDGTNSIVPMDASRYGQYSSVRQSLALPQGALLRLGSSDFGLHPSLQALAPIFAEGKLAPVFNVGPLNAPMTKAEFLAAPDSAELIPDNLFSHSDQQILWETSTTNAQERTGWGGRAAQIMRHVNPVISVGGNGRFGLSSAATPLVLPGPGETFGAYAIQGSDTQWEPNRLRRAAIDALYAQQAELTLGTAYQRQQAEAFTMSQRLGDLVKRRPAAGNTLDAAFAPITDANGRITTPLGRQLYQVAKLIEGNATVQGDRQIFFAQQGGFDTHGNQIANGNALEGEHMRLLKSLGDAMACFYNAMKAIGMSNAVTLFTQSDFGRTLKPNNSSGTDHAWGNHHFVLGGGVRGGQFYGTYPQLVLGGPDDAGEESWERQGRWIPTTSVDQYAATLLSWFGADASTLDGVLPNLRNFGSRRTVGFV
jgi:uncharacterized protein (DUF1501 family)